MGLRAGLHRVPDGRRSFQRGLVQNIATILLLRTGERQEGTGKGRGYVLSLGRGPAATSIELLAGTEQKESRVRDAHKGRLSVGFCGFV